MALREQVFAFATLIAACAEPAPAVAPSGPVEIAVQTGSSPRPSAPSAIPTSQPGAPAGWRTVSCPPARTHHTATLLADGRVLVAGGVGGARSATPLADAHLFDPAKDTWTATPAMPEARYHHTATRLDDGRVVLAGGQAASTLTSTVAFDVRSTSWSALGPLSAARRGHSAAIANGSLHVAGGLDGRGHSGMREVERLDALRGTFVPAPALQQARYLHSATELPGGGLVLADSTGLEVYPGGAALGAISSWQPLSVAVALAPDRVLFVGGMDDGHRGVPDALFWDAGRGWSAAAAMSEGRFNHSATRLRDGRVLVVGGASAELFDPKSGAWSPAPPPASPHVLHTATLLADGSVLVALGSGATCERFDPGVGTP